MSEAQILHRSSLFFSKYSEGNLPAFQKTLKFLPGWKLKRNKVKKKNWEQIPATHFLSPEDVIRSSLDVIEYLRMVGAKSRLLEQAVIEAIDLFKLYVYWKIHFWLVTLIKLFSLLLFTFTFFWGGGEWIFDFAKIKVVDCRQNITNNVVVLLIRFIQFCVKLRVEMITSLETAGWMKRLGKLSKSKMLNCLVKQI